MHGFNDVLMRIVREHNDQQQAYRNHDQVVAEKAVQRFLRLEYDGDTRQRSDHVTGQEEQHGDGLNNVGRHSGYQIPVDGKAPQQHCTEDEIVDVGRNLMVGSDPVESLVFQHVLYVPWILSL
ncbi:hypothetical protein D3C72_1836850 [compost metagenome]